MMKKLAPLMAALFVTFVSTAAQATPLNQWKVSCSVDKGSIQKKGNTRIFKTSANHCPGGTFNQRAEILSKKVSRNHKGKYKFTSTIRMTNDKNEKFDIFQMHDGRNGCAPPLKVTVLSNGRFKLRADYKTGKGESCIRDVFAQSKKTNVVFKRNGQSQQLEVSVDFLGKQRFSVQVFLDGKLAAQGDYTPPEGSRYITSKHFYFKHGVYSKRMFDYEMISQNMSVKRIKK
ncbi:MAG: heparin lyase I family protein [Amylibacter sp.]|nr:heparin lyase I family protein [Amylibacter sp.]